MKGNGCAGSIASGVSTGKMRLRKISSIAGRSAAVMSLASSNTRPAPASSARIAAQMRCCSAIRSLAAVLTLTSCCDAERPSWLSTRTPSRTSAFRPATRTMKNSSRLLAEIDRKRSRSSSGWRGLSASSSTLWLKLSHESSRLKKRSGDRIRSGAAGVGAATGNAADSATWASNGRLIRRLGNGGCLAPFRVTNKTSLEQIESPRVGFKNLARQGAGDFAFFRVRRLVETHDDLTRHSNRPFDPPHQVRIDILGRLYVPFPEEFAQQTFEHRVVGFADLGDVDGVQARAQIGQLGRPGERMAARREQQSLARSGHVDQVEQGVRMGAV